MFGFEKNVNSTEICTDIYMYMCSLCNRYRGSGFAPVLRYIKIFDPGLSIVCGLKSCPATYTNYKLFRSHVYRKNRDKLFLNSTEPTRDSHSEETDSSLLDWEDTDAFDENHGFSTKQHDLKPSLF